MNFGNIKSDFASAVNDYNSLRKPDIGVDKVIETGNLLVFFSETIIPDMVNMKNDWSSNKAAARATAGTIAAKLATYNLPKTKQKFASISTTRRAKYNDTARRTIHVNIAAEINTNYSQSIAVNIVNSENPTKLKTEIDRIIPQLTTNIKTYNTNHQTNTANQPTLDQEAQRAKALQSAVEHLRVGGLRMMEAILTEVIERFSTLSTAALNEYNKLIQVCNIIGFNHAEILSIIMTERRDLIIYISQKKGIDAGVISQLLYQKAKADKYRIMASWGMDQNTYHVNKNLVDSGRYTAIYNF